MADQRPGHEPVVTTSERTASTAGALIAAALAVISLSDYLGDRDVLAALYIAVHAITAWLFVIRTPQTLRPSRRLPDVVAVLSLLSPYAYDASALDESGPAISAVLIAAAAYLLFGTLSLGRSFGILPALREVRTGLAYRIVRHPIYSAYLLMDVAILAADASPRNVTVFAIAALLLISRVRFEEQLLSANEEYRRYKEQVRYRLVPLVF